MKTLLFKTFILKIVMISLPCLAQIDSTELAKQRQNEEYYEYLINDTFSHNAIPLFFLSDSINLINSENQALLYAEAILLGHFQEKSVESMKPFDVNFHKNYWIITTHLPKKARGNIILIIIDARDGRVIKIGGF